MAGKRASLKGISQAAGVSVTTVSMILNGRANEFRISAATQEKVLKAAKKMNYQPNLHARNLRSRKSNIVAIMLPTLTNRFFSGMAETFEKLARDSGKFPLITTTHHNAAEEQSAINYFVSQGVDCVFIADPTALSEVTRMCAEAGVDQIVVDAHGGTGPVVTTDNFEAAKTLTGRLLDGIGEGRKAGDVYFVGGTETHSVTRRRLEGFRSALSEMKPGAAPSHTFIPTLFDMTAAREAFADLFAAQDQIAGVFVNSLPIMEGLLQYFPENRERCRATRYAVFDYHPLMEALELDFVCVRQHAEIMMSTAFDIYAAGLDTNSGQVHFIPYQLIESSIGNASSSQADTGPQNPEA